MQAESMGANKTGEDVNGFITEPPHPPATPSPHPLPPHVLFPPERGGTLLTWQSL